MRESPARPPSAPAPHGEEERIRLAFAARVPEDPRYAWTNPGQLFLVHSRERKLLAMLRRHGMTPLRDQEILEVGCGTGAWLRSFVQWGARPERVWGIDLLPDRVEEARRLCPAAMHIQAGNAAELPYADASFDVVFQSTVFTSVLDAGMRHAIAREMLRVARPDGLILWYDFHVGNPANRQVRAVTAREVRRLFAGCRIDLRRVSLAPPLVRRLAPVSWLACHLLEAVPFLCTHHVGAIRPPSAGAGTPAASHA